MLLPDQSIDASKVIQLMISPAVMISACGLLLLGANAKYSNVLNRIRLINDEKRRLVMKTADHGATPEEKLAARKHRSAIKASQSSCKVS